MTRGIRIKFKQHKNELSQSVKEQCVVIISDIDSTYKCVYC